MRFLIRAEPLRSATIQSAAVFGILKVRRGLPKEFMRYLYVLMVLSLAVLLWAAIAIAKHIRKHEAQTTGPDMEPIAQHDAAATLTTVKRK